LEELFKLNYKVIDEDGNSLILLKFQKLLKDKGVPETEAHKILTASSELLSNVVKYAKYGEITISGMAKNNKLSGIKVVVEDTGPGIEDIDLALKDNYSTQGTLGLGLPGVKRMVDVFKIESGKRQGTRVTIKKMIHQYD